MKIVPFQSLIIKESVDNKQLRNNHRSVLKSEIYFRNRNQKFENSDIPNLYAKLIQRGILERNDNFCIYIHEEKDDTHEVRTILACVDILESVTERIIKHEDICNKKKEDMCACFNICPLQSEPILLFVRESYNSIETIVNNFIKNNVETYCFNSFNNIKHRYWKIKDSKEINKLIEAFKDINELYVADGHHRLCSLETLYNRNKKYNNNSSLSKIYANIVSIKDINTVDFSREWEVICYENLKLKCDEYITKTQKYFEIQKVLSTDNTNYGDMIMTICGKSYSLKRKTKSNSNKSSVELFYLYIEPLMKSVFGDYKEIDPIEIDELLEVNNNKVRSSVRIKFIFKSPKIEDVVSLCEKGCKFPEKSTFFIPKVEDGVVICI